MYEAMQSYMFAGHVNKLFCDWKVLRRVDEKIIEKF
jgi:hypothetical protein